MIVRPYADGWFLLRQADHARLSAQLAKSMALPPFDQLGCRNELIEAIELHDNGWVEWDNERPVDPQLGRPRSFNEMDPLDSYAIWQTSVELAVTRSPLAGWAVAGHFLRLTTIQSTDEIGQKWSRWAEEQRLVCLAQWLGEGPDRDIALAENAVDWLRFFDSFSLNLCRGNECEPFPLKAPTGSDWDMIWRAPNSLEIAPWTFDATALEFELPIQRFPGGAEAQELLRWRLRPAGSVQTVTIDCA